MTVSVNCFELLRVTVENREQDILEKRASFEYYWDEKEVYNKILMDYIDHKDSEIFERLSSSLLSRFLNSYTDLIINDSIKTLNQNVTLLKDRGFIIISENESEEALSFISSLSILLYSWITSSLNNDRSIKQDFSPINKFIHKAFEEKPILNFHSDKNTYSIDQVSGECFSMNRSKFSFNIHSIGISGDKITFNTNRPMKIIQDDYVKVTIDEIKKLMDRYNDEIFEGKLVFNFPIKLGKSSSYIGKVSTLDGKISKLTMNSGAKLGSVLFNSTIIHELIHVWQVQNMDYHTLKVVEGFHGKTFQEWCKKIESMGYNNPGLTESGLKVDKVKKSYVIGFLSNHINKACFFSKEPNQETKERARRFLSIPEEAKEFEGQITTKNLNNGITVRRVGKDGESKIRATEISNHLVFSDIRDQLVN
jgi:hypothetical protein